MNLRVCSLGRRDLWSDHPTIFAACPVPSRLDEHFAAKPRHGRYPLQEIIKIPWTIREFDQEVLLELLAVQQGLPVNPRTVRHAIRALRPGQIGKVQIDPK